ncbi:MAG: hypothetical protein ACFCVF_17460 [Kineosporiaceae bacterium]
MSPRHAGRAAGRSDDLAEAARPPRTAGTHGGADADASKEHLSERATQLGLRGRSRMTRDELVAALRRASDRETRRAHGS